jgi:pilus assembly protein CpaE
VSPAEPRTAPLTTPPGDRPLLLAYVADEPSEQALKGGLLPLFEALQVRRGTVRQAARALEREPTPLVLIVDISGVADPVAALDELAAVCAPDVRVLVVGDRQDIGFYREMTRDLGVEEYIFKPLTRDNVGSLFGPHLTQALGGVQRGSNRGGRVVAVCGARGGVGTTTVAANLALQLSETTRGHVALLDLHLRGGAIAMAFGTRVGAGLRIALEDPDRVDTLFVDRVALPLTERLRIIAAEEPIEAMPTPTVDGLVRLFEVLRGKFNTIVVDMPMPPQAVEREVLKMARHRILVMGPDVASIRDAQAVRRMMASLGQGTAPLVTLNRAGQRGALATTLVQEGLGQRPDFIIPDLPKHLPRAMNLGRPALHDSPAFSRALAPLTQEISGTAAPAASRVWPMFPAWLRRS